MSSHRIFCRRRVVAPGMALLLGAGLVLATALPAVAADAVAPVVTPATLTPATPEGNNNWRHTPSTLNLSATDDVAVDKFQYSLDAGLTYVDVQVADAPIAAATAVISQEGNTTVRYRAVDTSGNVSRGATTNTTLNQASAAGATAVRLPSTAGRSAGDLLVIDTGAAQETATIATIVTPAPASPAPNVTLTAPLANAHAAGAAVQSVASYNTIAVLIDTHGPVATWATQPTTLQAAASAGAASVRLASTTGRVPGEALQIDQGANAENVTIESIVSPAPPAPEPNVTLSSALTKSHLSGAAVYLPAIIDGQVLQSKTLTPLRTDPRRRDVTDTVANGAGGAAIRRMVVDGEIVIPKPLPLNTLTVGKHTQSVALQDTAGSVAKYTNTFAVTTSFDDLSTVIDQYANNALNSTLNGATVAGATALRFADATRYGFRAGQTLVVDSGASQETVTIGRVLSPPATVSTTLSAPAAAGATEVRLANYTTATTGGPNAPTVNGPVAGQPIVLDTGGNLEVISVARHIVPVPAAPAPNVVLSAPLAKHHAAGTTTAPTTVVLEAPLTLPHVNGTAVFNPRPLISASAASTLHALLTKADEQADAGSVKTAVATLNRFKAAAQSEAKSEKAALTSAADALIDQLRGGSVDTAGTGVIVGPVDPGDQALRVFWNPTTFTANPAATYKILVNGRSGGFRHQSIVDVEAMFQKLGAENGFDVDIWDPNINQSPGRQAPAGVSLPTSPLLDLAALMEYKTLVFDSTVGLNAAGLTSVEFANLQSYVRAGGGVVAIHGATDSMQNVPWYMDLVGAGFINHGSNAGGILIDTESGGHVELSSADPSHPATSGISQPFFTVEELYNTNRNPVELGTVHPLVYENEDTLVGQIGYGTGALMNTDQHAMVWCRNFDGGRSFTSTLGHSWQYMTAPWYQNMMLQAVEWTAGKASANCVTYTEVADLLAAGTAAGVVTPAGNAALGELLASARSDFDQGGYQKAVVTLNRFVEATEDPANGDATALAELNGKGKELISWAKGLK